MNVQDDFQQIGEKGVNTSTYGENSSDQNNLYWRTMYEELEQQMYDMMEMTQSLVEKESSTNHEKGTVYSRFDATSAPADIRKEFRRLQLFEHRINVTFIGKVAILYIAMKRKVKKLLNL